MGAVESGLFQQKPGVIAAYTWVKSSGGRRAERAGHRRFRPDRQANFYIWAERVL